MRVLRAAALAAATATIALAAPAASQAAVPGDLCQTSVATFIWYSENHLYTVGAGQWVRIDGYYGSGYYLAHANGATPGGIIERQTINQSTCHQ